MQNTYFFLSFLMFILPYCRERTGILVWRAVVCVFARLRLCFFFFFTAILYLEVIYIWTPIPVWRALRSSEDWIILTLRYQLRQKWRN